MRAPTPAEIQAHYAELAETAEQPSGEGFAYFASMVHAETENLKVSMRGAKLPQTEIIMGRIEADALEWLKSQGSKNS